MLGEAYGDGRFDDHDGIWIDAHHLTDDCLHCRCVEEVSLCIVVGRGGDNHKVGLPIGCVAIERGMKVEVSCSEILLNLLVFDGRLLPVQQVHFLGYNVNRLDMMVLAEQHGHAKTDIACSGNSDIQFIVHCL